MVYFIFILHQSYLFCTLIHPWKHFCQCTGVADFATSSENYRYFLPVLFAVLREYLCVRHERYQEVSVFKTIHFSVSPILNAGWFRLLRMCQRCSFDIFIIIIFILDVCDLFNNCFLLFLYGKDIAIWRNMIKYDICCYSIIRYTLF